jgi:hypothetical protein
MDSIAVAIVGKWVKFEKGEGSLRVRTQKNKKKISHFSCWGFVQLGLEPNQCSATVGTEFLKKSHCLKEIQVSRDVSSVAFYGIAFRSNALRQDNHETVRVWKIYIYIYIYMNTCSKWVAGQTYSTANSLLGLVRLKSSHTPSRWQLRIQTKLQNAVPGVTMNELCAS